MLPNLFHHKLQIKSALNLWTVHKETKYTCSFSHNASFLTIENILSKAKSNLI